VPIARELSGVEHFDEVSISNFQTDLCPGGYILKCTVVSNWLELACFNRLLTFSYRWSGFWYRPRYSWLIFHHLRMFLITLTTVGRQVIDCFTSCGYEFKEDTMCRDDVNQWLIQVCHLCKGVSKMGGLHISEFFCHFLWMQIECTMQQHRYRFCTIVFPTHVFHTWLAERHCIPEVHYVLSCAYYLMSYPINCNATGTLVLSLLSFLDHVWCVSLCK